MYSIKFVVLPYFFIWAKNVVESRRKKRKKKKRIIKSIREIVQIAIRIKKNFFKDNQLLEEKLFRSFIYVLNGTKFERPIRIVSPAVPSRYFSILFDSY